MSKTKIDKIRYLLYKYIKLDIQYITSNQLDKLAERISKLKNS